MIDEYALSSAKIYDPVAREYLLDWLDKRPTQIAKRFARSVKEGMPVLDVACGPGLDVRLLRDVGLTAVSGDLSFGCMQEAQTHHPRGLLACWDYNKLPFADNTFGGIWAPAALGHYPRKNIVPVLKEWMRVQANGPLVFSIPEGDEDFSMVPDPPAAEYVPSAKCTLEQVQSLLLHLGYVDVEVESRLDPRGIDLRWVQAWAMAPTS